ncbi:ABC transporter permease (plasmid) [Rhizobium sp. CB3060]|uniref:ABC transporter permease n=1 Tax=Rhizobium sp. CB3060 TaxID=3138255 RepID=UPI0021A4520A|nr:ABC transporter permease [Rhizobium tropici]UWU25500.1 ABC transporter permease [Rhizobium tropici]
MVAATPLIIAGAAFIVGAKAGLFNIGLEGQLLVGGMAGLIAGFSLPGLPLVIHLPLALAFAFVAGGIWAGFAGWMKVASGAHEVITTIMLNFLALRLVEFLLRHPPVQNPERADPISKSVLDSAALPPILAWLDPSLRVNFGILLALLVALAVGFLLWRTKLGFEIRVMGVSPRAGRVAGMNPARTIILSMVLSGGIAGLAGASLTLGVLGRATPDFTAGLGFEAIAVALLARLHPVGVVFSGILFGALTAGGRYMGVAAGVSIDLVTVIQAVVLLCIAAPVLIKRLYPFIFSSAKEV